MVFRSRVEKDLFTVVIWIPSGGFLHWSFSPFTFEMPEGVELTFFGDIRGETFVILLGTSTHVPKIRAARKWAVCWKFRRKVSAAWALFFDEERVGEPQREDVYGVAWRPEIILRT